MLEPLLSNSVAMFWLIMGILLLIFEAVTVALLSIWFALGAIAAMFIALLGLPLWLQVLVFLTVSGLLLLITKPLALKIREQSVPTNADRIIGQMGKVVQKIDNLNARGQVEVLGQTWSARSEDDSVIDEGEIVRALKIAGVKVIVKKQEEPVPVAQED